MAFVHVVEGPDCYREAPAITDGQTCLSVCLDYILCQSVVSMSVCQLRMYVCMNV